MSDDSSSSEGRMVIVTDDENEYDIPEAGADAGSDVGAVSGATTGADAGAIAGADSGAIASADTGAVTGANSGAIAGADTGAIADAEARAVVSADSDAIAATDTDAIAGAEARAVAGADSSAIAGAATGAIAGAEARAVAGADSSAIAGAATGAIAGAEARAVAGADSGAIAGADTGAIAGAEARAVAGVDSGAIAGADTDAIAGADTGAFAGANSGSVAGAAASVGQVANVIRPVQPFHDVIVRAGPSWATACELADPFSQNLASQVRPSFRHLLRGLSTPSRSRSRQSTRGASRPSRRKVQQSEQETPYVQHNRRGRKTRATTRNYPNLTYPTQATPTLAIPPLYPINQNPGQPQRVQYQTLRQTLNPNYMHSTQSQIAVGSPSQWFASRASAQLTARISPMVYINPPHLVPIAPAPRTQTPTSAASSFHYPFVTERPLDLRVPQRAVYPNLIPISQTLPVRVRQAEPRPSVRPTPRTHTVTSTTSTVVYLPSTFVGQINTVQPRQTERRIELYSTCSEHLLNQPARHQLQMSADSLLEHQQCQLWPLDTFVATDLIEEAETSECDLWLGIESVADSAALSPSVSSIPVTRPLPTLVIVPTSPITTPTTTKTTTTTTAATTTTTTSSSEVRTLLSDK